MKKIVFIVAAMASMFLMFTTQVLASGGDAHQESYQKNKEEKKGPNNGKLLTDGDFTLELVLFERGVPPQYRIFPSINHQKINPSEVKVTATLTRLGNFVDNINFSAQSDHLQGDLTIYEPHSFEVNIQASYQGKNYQWQYENFEGRTEIVDDMAKQMGITTSIISSQQLSETVTVYGEIKLAPNAERHISARFPGLVTQLKVELGQQVKKGQHLFTVESDESLQQYQVFAPISGVISEQNINVGEQTLTDKLLTITNTANLFAELKVYPLDWQKVKKGAVVTIRSTENNSQVTTQIFDHLVALNDHQAKVFRAKIDNRDGQISVGEFVSGEISVAQYQVPLAVDVDALQGFRDFTVVYQKIGQQYEVRMLELGRRDGQWVEVLSGIKAGSEYVSGNSYLIKADIDKAGAAHDH